MNRRTHKHRPATLGLARGRGVGLILALLIVLPQLQAQRVVPNVWWYPDDPFVTPGSPSQGTIPLPDWTSRPAGSLSAPSVSVERISASGALGTPSLRSLGPAPSGARFALVNQYASDISVFALNGSPPKSAPGDGNGNGLPDDWEQRHFNQTAVDPAADLDGDGFTNLAEFEAGTDPNQAASHPLIPGMLGLWSGENSAGDSVGGHDGSWLGTASYVQGRIGSAFSCSSAGSIRIPDAAELRLDRALSIAAWIRLANSTCDLQPILARPSSNEGLPAFALSVNCQGIRLGLANAFASSLDGPALTLSTGIWYHVAATWDGTNTQIYLNGRVAFGQRRNGAFAPLDLPAGRDLRIGSDGATRAFAGALDQVVLAGRSLSAVEIRWLAGGNDGRRGTIADATLVVEREDQTLWRQDSPTDLGSLLSHGYDAHLSGDRRRLVFRRAQTTPEDPASERLWLRDLVSGEETSLFSLPQTGERISLDWSADDAAILVADAVRRRIERYSLNEGPLFPPTLLVDTTASGSPGELSVHRQDGSLAWFMTTDDFTRSVPWTAGGEGQNAQSVPGTQAESVALRQHRPSWSPDGTKLALLSGRNLSLIRPDGTGRLPLTFYSGGAGEPVILDALPAWTVSADYLVTVATFPQRDVRARVVYIATDGSGGVQEKTDEGAAPKQVVFGGSGPAAKSLELSVGIDSPTPGDTVPALIFTSTGGTDELTLESASGLDTLWQPHPAQLTVTPNQRRWRVLLDPTEPFRFFRLQQLRQ